MPAPGSRPISSSCSRSGRPCGSGSCSPGDQLPTVKEVVGSLAINPNTVLKAYRELDHEGLVEGRRGVGTFVSSAPPPPPPDGVKELRAVAAALGRRARARPGSTTTHIAALFGDTAAPARRLEGRMSDGAALRADGLGKRYGAKWALQDCTLEIPAGSVTALVGPNGAGKTTLLQLAVGLVRPSAGSVQRARPARRATTRAALLPRVGFVAQEHPLYRRPDGRRDADARAQAQPELGRRARAPRGSSGSGCRPARRSAGSRAASRRRSRSRSRSRSGRSCCCSTSRSRRSIRSRGASSSSR